MTGDGARRLRGWLRHQRGRHDLVGDLARDACADADWPTNETTLDGLHEYLTGCGAVDGAHDALDLAWDEWQRGRR